MSYAQLGLLFLAGVAASLHCLGMCNVFSLSAGSRGVWYLALYNAGRLFSYGAIGALAGALGKLAWAIAILNGFELGLSIFLGLAMIALGLRLLGVARRSVSPNRLRFSFISRSEGTGLAGKMSGVVESSLAPLMPPAGGTQAFTLGVLNGLLPCPIVHAFLPVALAIGSVGGSTLSMLAVGLGTVPAMFALGFLGSFRRPVFLKSWLATSGPGMVVLLFGIFTIARAGLVWFHHDISLM